MKKVLILASVLFVFGMTSCKKDYSCDCTLTNGSVSAQYSGVKKSEAEDGCAELETAQKLFDSDAACTLTAK